MDNIRIITDEVIKLLGMDNSGHGMDHVNRVCRIALSICENDINKEFVLAIALLHDVDDYKLFGIECSNNLTNNPVNFAVHYAEGHILPITLNANTADPVLISILLFFFAIRA